MQKLKLKVEIFVKADHNYEDEFDQNKNILEPINANEKTQRKAKESLYFS